MAERAPIPSAPGVADAAPPLIRQPVLRAVMSLRFFAAFLILVLHYGMWFAGEVGYSWSDRRPYVPYFIQGGAGVTFFYVLSGFILAYTYVHTHIERPAQRRQFFVAVF